MTPAVLSIACVGLELFVVAQWLPGVLLHSSSFVIADTKIAQGDRMPTFCIPEIGHKEERCTAQLKMD